MRLSPEQHLRTQRDFQNVRQAGRRYQCDAFTLWWWARADFARTARERPTESVSVPEPARMLSPTAYGALSPLRPAYAAPLRRIGVVASRAAVGNAVQRNRAKRRLRTLFRLHQDDLPSSGDLLLVARHLLNRLPWSVLEKRFLGICAQLCRALPPAPPAAFGSPVPRPLTSDV